MVKIFIEGKGKNVPEEEFLHAILNHIGVNPSMYEIVNTGGYTSLLDSKNTPFIELIRANTDSGGINLIVFDADYNNNNGGYYKRRKELIDKRDELGLVFNLFLWPNNEADGDVEILMESIARKDLYPEFFDCFTKYERCISHRKNEKGEPYYSLPNRKGKLHTYFHAIPISKAKKNLFGRGAWRWDDKDIWDLDSESLKPIKEFLTLYIH